ncbi:MAG: hypothetical protein ACUVTX_02280 [Bacteroidales bacterium]
MYIDQIVIYLTWPVFIIMSWIIIRSALILYERKIQTRDESEEERSDKGRDK